MAITVKDSYFRTGAKLIEGEMERDVDEQNYDGIERCYWKYFNYKNNIFYYNKDNISF